MYRPVLPDLAECDDEQIHIPGYIQAHGALLVLDPDNLNIVQVSENCQPLLARETEGLLGSSVMDLLSEQSGLTIRGLLESRSLEEVNPINVTLSGANSSQNFEGVFHATPDGLLLELTPQVAESESDLMRLDASLSATTEMLDTTNDASHACNVTATAIRRLVDFDRVMVYQFDTDWNGSVIAESSAPGVSPSYLGHQFPAGDVPRIARRMYELNPVRLIYDSHAEPSGLSPERSPLTGNSPDLSLSVLRGVSPFHLQYLQNMGVRASMSISIVIDGKLWGLIACHHYEPRKVSFSLRRTAVTLSRYVSRVIGDHVRQEELRRYQVLQEELEEATINVGSADDFDDAVRVAAPALLNAFEASGMVLASKDRKLAFGSLPSEIELEVLISFAEEHLRGHRACFQSHLLRELIEGELQTCGLLGIRLTETPSSTLFFLRKEAQEEILWAGKNESDEPDDHRLSPRKSFEAWVVRTKDRSRRWTSTDVKGIALLRSLLVEREQARLLKRLSLFEAVVRATSEGVIITNGDIDNLQIVFANDAITQITGYERDELVGETPKMFQGKDSDPQVMAQISEAVRAGKDYRGDILNYRKDGSTFWDYLRISPIHDENGNITAYVSVQEDVSWRYQDTENDE